MHKYNHLNIEERERIWCLKEKGLSLRDIAEAVKRDVSTISRELSRHTRYWKPYLPCVAQKEADRVCIRQRQRSALKNPLIFLYVREHLRSPYCWSPETISGRLSLDHLGESICPESIYRYIYLNKRTKREKLWKYLLLHRKKRMKKDGRKVKTGYSKLTEAILVSERPDHINKRLELGHWETDNMEGVRSDRSSISVTTERVTRIVRLSKLSGHGALVKTKALVSNLSTEDDGFVKSVTMDRGPENSGYRKVRDTLDIDIYGCAPYHSWEKGTVENTIKRLRKYIPKGTSIKDIDQLYLTLLENRFNNTPRKILGFLTPNEYYERIHSASYI